MFSNETNCGPEKMMENTSSMVYTAISSGQGYAGFMSATTNLKLRPIGSHRYEAYKHFNGKKIIAKNSENIEGIRACVFQKYTESGILPDEDGILNVDISFDGTWMKRGRTSHIGAAAVIDVLTGFENHELLSNYCFICTRLKTMTAAQKQKHAENCHKIFDGKSGAMEKEQAIRMFQRSEERKFRYVTFVSEGDSSSYRAVTALNDGAGPYANIPVTKEKYVNLIAKRLGTRLRVLKKTTAGEFLTSAWKKRKKAVLGGRHKLTDAVIDKLTLYFGKAIRDCIMTSVGVMRSQALAGFYHATSSNKDDRDTMIAQRVPIPTAFIIKH